MVSTGQNATMVSGDTLVIQITVTDETGTAVNLTDHDIDWILTTSKNSSTPILSKAVSSGITITNAASGIFQVTMDPVDTADLHGDYWHEACITTPTLQKYTVTNGYITIERDAIQ